MRKILFLMTLIAISIAAMQSCKNGKKNDGELSIKPETTQIKGDLGDYFEVVEKDYKIPLSENRLDQLISIEIRRKDKDFPFDVSNINPFGTNGGEEYHVGFGIELLGDNGVVELKNATEGGMSGPYSGEDVLSLFKLKKGESGYIRWTVEKIEGLKKFKIISAMEKSNFSNSLSSNTLENSDLKNFTDGGSEIDRMLDDYENYVDQYILYFQKANQGDMTALSEYPTLIEKAQQLEGSLTQAQNNNNFSAEQMKRMIAIQQKMMNESIDMQNSN